MSDNLENPCDWRMESFVGVLRRRHISVALVFGEANIRSLTGVACDNACLVVPANGKDPVFVTDFRYVPMTRRVAPWLDLVELKSGKTFVETVKPILAKMKVSSGSIGFEGSIAASRYIDLQKKLPSAKFIDVNDDILALRAVKTLDEIQRIAAAEALNDEIWSRAQKEFKQGMTEKELQRVIRAWMNALGDGEAFETIVCVGANAAECHHVPDDTPWHGEALLVDMGVKLNGVCSDMTRCIKPKKLNLEYNKIYDIVLRANQAAIKAAKPGITAGALDKVARDFIAKSGNEKAFGHSLGHGVGYEIHELPTARPSDKMVLEPGMIVTIEPGIYLEGKLGVRIEDLILITPKGCEVLSKSKK